MLWVLFWQNIIIFICALASIFEGELYVWSRLLIWSNRLDLLIVGVTPSPVAVAPYYVMPIQGFFPHWLSECLVSPTFQQRQTVFNTF